MPPMLWDIFCRVIDNFGDIGVCWRLSADLAERGHRVRLWIDDTSALKWMAIPQPSIAVHDWEEAENHPPAPGDVVVESFGCDPPAAFVLGMHRSHPSTWINLEYLSAEDYVERSHGLMSPVWSGAGAGLKKWFFYPGFTAQTGGLLRETSLAPRQKAFFQNTPSLHQWLADVGVQADPRIDHSRKLSVFCYPTAPLPALLDVLSKQLLARDGASVTLLLTPGHATDLALRWKASLQQPEVRNLLGTRLHWVQLPLLTQPRFDEFLWLSDLNMVRGEDSAVRALWAHRPHVWQIYEQDDGVHTEKLHAFTNKWMKAWPQPTHHMALSAWDAWNNLAPTTQLAGLVESLLEPEKFAIWQEACTRSHEKLANQADLTSQLLEFVSRSG